MLGCVIKTSSGKESRNHEFKNVRNYFSEDEWQKSFFGYLMQHLFWQSLKGHCIDWVKGNLTFVSKRANSFGVFVPRKKFENLSQHDLQIQPK